MRREVLPRYSRRGRPTRRPRAAVLYTRNIRINSGCEKTANRLGQPCLVSVRSLELAQASARVHRARRRRRVTARESFRLMCEPRRRREPGARNDGMGSVSARRALDPLNEQGQVIERGLIESSGIGGGCSAAGARLRSVNIGSAEGRTGLTRAWRWNGLGLSQSIRPPTDAWRARRGAASCRYSDAPGVRCRWRKTRGWAGASATVFGDFEGRPWAISCVQTIGVV